MKLKTTGLFILVWLIAGLWIAGCQSDEESRTADSLEPGSAPSSGDSLAVGVEADRPETPDPEKLRYHGPKPAKGSGNVYGKVMWNSAAAPGLDMLLCQDYNSFSGCSGRAYTAVTDEAGYYLFADVEPGVYAMSIHIFNSDDWLYVSGGILSAADFEVEANETMVVDVQNIYKLDVRTLKPGDEATVKSGRVTVNWEAYADAAFYEIYLTPDEGEPIYVNEMVRDTQITANLPPINCEYRWSLEVFNVNEVKIAETADFVEFQVTGEQASCHLTINAPVDGSVISAQGIVLEWEPQLLAANYKILMWDDSDPERTKILDFITVNESRFVFNGALMPDHRYVWSVYAYDTNGDEVAASEIHDFTVTP